MAGSAFFPRPKASPPPTVGQGAWVIAQVCREKELTPAQIKGHSRAREFVDARMRVAVILHRDRGWSLPRIGWLLGGRDPTTILHLVRKAENMGIYDIIKLADREDACHLLGLALDQVVFLLVVTIRHMADSVQLSVNARAPLIIDSERQIGYQHVLSNSKYEVRHTLD